MEGTLRLAVAGLGTVSGKIIDAALATPGVAFTAAADLRQAARDRVAAKHGVPVFDTVAAMCRSGLADAVWIATPNERHCEHVVAAAESGCHVICEKPLAVSLDEADRMIAAARAAGVRLVQGGSKIMQPPIRAIRSVIAGGALGRVTQVTSINYNDWLQRPRLAVELDAERGGGIVFRQGPHMVDIVRRVVGDQVCAVRAVVGRSDPFLAAEGNFAALLEFESGAVANLTLNGYGYFDSGELVWGMGEGGNQRSEAELRRARPRRRAPLSEAEKYAGAAGLAREPAAIMPFYGLLIVSCERGVIRQSPSGLLIYTEAGCKEMPLTPDTGAPELVELRAALAENRPVFPDGSWGRDTLAVCLAIRESSLQRRAVVPPRQSLPA